MIQCDIQWFNALNIHSHPHLHGEMRSNASYLSDSSHLPALVSSYKREISLDVAAKRTAPSTLRIDTLLPVNDIIIALRPNSSNNEIERNMLNI